MSEGVDWRLIGEDEVSDRRAPALRMDAGVARDPAGGRVAVEVVDTGHSFKWSVYLTEIGLIDAGYERTLEAAVVRGAATGRGHAG